MFKKDTVTSEFYLSLHNIKNRQNWPRKCRVPKIVFVIQILINVEVLYTCKNSFYLSDKEIICKSFSHYRKRGKSQVYDLCVKPDLQLFPHQHNEAYFQTLMIKVSLISPAYFLMYRIILAYMEPNSFIYMCYQCSWTQFQCGGSGGVFPHL